MPLRRKSQTSLPTEPVRYPLGTYVKSERGYFFILTEDKRMHIISERVLDSWAPPRVVKTTEAALANYRVSSRLKMRNGSLIHSISDGRIYLIEGGKRRHVQSPEALSLIGAVLSDTIVVSQKDLLLHEEGEPLT